MTLRLVESIEDARKRAALRAWLDRKPPSKTDDERRWREFFVVEPVQDEHWEFFEVARAADPLAEAGHG